MRYFLEFARLWDYIFSDNENLKSVAIILKDKKLEDYAELKYQEKCVDNIIA